MKVKAVAAVNAGLDHPEDPYKRATIGNQALIGLGEFRTEQPNVSVLVATLPADWRARYIATSQVIEETERAALESETERASTDPLPIASSDRNPA